MRVSGRGAAQRVAGGCHRCRYGTGRGGADQAPRSRQGLSSTATTPHASSSRTTLAPPAVVALPSTSSRRRRRPGAVFSARPRPSARSRQVVTSSPLTSSPRRWRPHPPRSAVVPSAPPQLAAAADSPPNRHCRLSFPPPGSRHPGPPPPPPLPVRGSVIHATSSLPLAVVVISPCGWSNTKPTRGSGPAAWAGRPGSAPMCATAACLAFVTRPCGCHRRRRGRRPGIAELRHRLSRRGCGWPPWSPGGVASAARPVGR